MMALFLFFLPIILLNLSQSNNKLMVPYNFPWTFHVSLCTHRPHQFHPGPLSSLKFPDLPELFMDSLGISFLTWGTLMILNPCKERSESSLSLLWSESGDWNFVYCWKHPWPLEQCQTVHGRVFFDLSGRSWVGVGGWLMKPSWTSRLGQHLGPWSICGWIHDSLEMESSILGPSF